MGQECWGSESPNSLVGLLLGLEGSAHLDKDMPGKVRKSLASFLFAWLRGVIH